MVQAAATGVIDFREFDPRDTWSWKRLDWLLNSLERQHVANTHKISHVHWLSRIASQRLSDDTIKTALTNSDEALSAWLRSTFPWLSDQIGQNNAQAAQEAVISAYEAEFGKPGDPHYEAMLDNLLKELKKGPMTQREKEKQRAKRRLKRQQELENRGG